MSAGLLTRLVLITAVLAACEPATEPPEGTNAAAIQVGVTGVRRGPIAEVLTVTGETAALSVLRLASPVAGRVTLLNVRAGDPLPAGEVAARVMPLENEAALHGFALLEGGTQRSADERVLTSRLRHELARSDIPLRVPFSAVVADRLHNPGEQVAQNDVLLELFDPRSLYVLAQVPMQDAARISTGMRVEISFGEQVAPGEVAALLTALAPQTLTIPVRISLSAPLRPPLLHAAVQCRVTLARHADALLIPRSALLSSTVGDHGLVMVAAGGQAEQRSVQLGLHTEDEVEVTGGLADSDLVLVQGQYSLPNGTRIEPVPVAK
jgi:multidrug efflux pump subunit AcrA (membrane-fusion protein)